MIVVNIKIFRRNGQDISNIILNGYNYDDITDNESFLEKIRDDVEYYLDDNIFWSNGYAYEYDVVYETHNIYNTLKNEMIKIDKKLQYLISYKEELKSEQLKLHIKDDPERIL